MQTAELDFILPPELIAQTPAARRTDARLMHYRRTGGAIAHKTVHDLPTLLRPGDLLVFNDAKVMPARFALRKPTGGVVEGLYVAPAPGGRWRVMLKNLGHFDPFLPLQFIASPQSRMRVESQTADGQYVVSVSDGDVNTLLQRVGRMPLPPYIKREKATDARDANDRERYQTVFAKTDGSIAAPTAGLHFTPELLARLDDAGVARAFVSLEVGLGTFKPVESDTLEGHAMHVERYTLPAETAAAVNDAKRDGRRVIAVGTTSARVLESQPPGELAATGGETGIFITPGYAWKHVDSLLTNFHLPRSTLIALVAAMTGVAEQKRIYATAIENRYRFFSYGDALWIE